MTIETNLNIVAQSSDLATVTATGAILIAAADEGRIKLSFALPLNNDTMCVVISATEAEANTLEGELIGQTFPSNASIFIPRLLFDMDSDAQGAKWAIVDDSLQGAESSINILVNKYTG